MARRQTRTDRWTAAIARGVLGEQQSSGLNTEEFARQRGLCSNRLRWWRKRLGGVHEAVVETGTLLPVRVVGEPRPVVGGLEVALRSGHVLRLTGSWDEATVRTVPSALEGLPC